MNVTRAHVPQRDQYLAQIDRLLNSHVLHGSESLCKLLRYLAEYSLDHPGSPLKEYQIATEVFGRSPSFDPQSDSTIRVQAGRLRLKTRGVLRQRGCGRTDPGRNSEGQLRGLVSPPRVQARRATISFATRPIPASRPPKARRTRNGRWPPSFFWAY